MTNFISEMSFSQKLKSTGSGMDLNPINALRIVNIDRTVATYSLHQVARPVLWLSAPGRFH